MSPTQNIFSPQSILPGLIFSRFRRFSRLKLFFILRSSSRLSSSRLSSSRFSSSRFSSFSRFRKSYLFSRNRFWFSYWYANNSTLNHSHHGSSNTALRNIGFGIQLFSNTNQARVTSTVRVELHPITKLLIQWNLVDLVLQSNIWE
jgi:hypothetical protein